jgi:hypothetical protein
MIRTIITATTALCVVVPAIAAEVPTQCTNRDPYQTAFNKQDVNGLVNLFTSDAIEAGPNGIIMGTDAIRAATDKTLNKDKMTNEVINVTKCYLEGDNIRWSNGDWQATSPQGPVGGVWGLVETKVGDTFKIRSLTYTAAPLDKK